MNFQSVEKLSAKFKEDKGWEVFTDGWEIVATNGHWRVEVETFAKIDDGDNYPYINLAVMYGDRYKTITSFFKMKDCIDYIKSYSRI